MHMAKRMVINRNKKILHGKSQLTSYEERTTFQASLMKIDERHLPSNHVLVLPGFLSTMSQSQLNSTPLQIISAEPGTCGYLHFFSQQKMLLLHVLIREFDRE